MTGPEDVGDWRPIRVQVDAEGPADSDACEWCAFPLLDGETGWQFAEDTGPVFCSRRCAVDWQMRQSIGA